MPKKICLVTGASGGLGKEIAFGLAANGEHVIMVCRNKEKGETVRNEIQSITGSSSIDLLIADLSSQASIKSLAQTIHERYPALHVLINNAGTVSAKKMISVDGIEMTLATNHLAPFLLTNLLLDLLQKSTPARVINISSAIHKWAKIDLTDLQFDRRKYQFMKAYAQSKLLLNITSFELAKKLEHTGITVNCIHPGAVRTSLGSNDSNHFILKIFDKIIKFFFITAKDAAIAPVELALNPDMQNITGKYFEKNKLVKASAISHDPIFAKKVWQTTEKLTHHPFTSPPVGEVGA